MGQRGEIPHCRWSNWSNAFRPRTYAWLLLVMASLAHAEGRYVVRRTTPEYPALAAKMRVSGTVRVVASVDAEGIVTEAHAVTGHALLRQAAEKAVLHWTFTAADKPTDTNIEVQFQLDAASAR